MGVLQKEIFLLYQIEWKNSMATHEAKRSALEKNVEYQRIAENSS